MNIGGLSVCAVIGSTVGWKRKAGLQGTRFYALTAIVADILMEVFAHIRSPLYDPLV